MYFKLRYMSYRHSSKSGLKIFVRAPKVSFLYPFLSKVSIKGTKMALWDYFYKPNIPPK